MATEVWEGATCSKNDINRLLVTIKVSKCDIVRQISDFSPIWRSGAHQVAKLAKKTSIAQNA